MKINDLGNIGTVELMIEEENALNICKQSIAVIARSLRVFTTGFPKPLQAGVEHIITIIQSIKDDRHCGMSAETALLIIACARVNPDDREGLYSRLSNMAYYLACHRRRITQFPPLDSEMLLRLSEIDPTNYSSALLSLTCYGGVVTVFNQYETTIPVKENPGFTIPDYPSEDNISQEVGRRAKYNYTSLSALFGINPVSNDTIVDNHNNLCEQFEQLYKSYENCLSDYDPLNGNYMFLLVLNIIRRSATIRLLRDTALYLASCRYTVETVHASVDDLYMLSDAIDRDGNVSRAALYIAEQHGVFSRVIVRKESTVVCPRSFKFPTPKPDNDIILEHTKSNYKSLSYINGPASEEIKSFDEIVTLWNSLCNSYDSRLGEYDPIAGNYPILLVLNICRSVKHAIDYIKATAHYMAACGYAVEASGLSLLDIQQLGETISRSGVVNIEAIRKVQQKGILDKIKIIEVSTEDVHVFPNRLLKELEALPDMSAVLDRVIKYQMLCSEETRRQDAKEALLVGFKYSLDIST